MAKKRPLKSPAQVFLDRLDPLVRSSFSVTQLSAIQEAFGEGDLKRRHAVDLRGVISFVVARFYYVFLSGRDRRSDMREGLWRRWRGAFGGTLAGAITLGTVGLMVLGGVYLYKLIFGG